MAAAIVIAGWSSIATLGGLAFMQATVPQMVAPFVAPKGMGSSGCFKTGDTGTPGTNWTDANGNYFYVDADGKVWECENAGSNPIITPNPTATTPPNYTPNQPPAPIPTNQPAKAVNAQQNANEQSGSGILLAVIAVIALIAVISLLLIFKNGYAKIDSTR